MTKKRTQRRGRTRRVPQRTCVVCRTRLEKQRLVRIVRSEQGIQIDKSGKVNGRGAYVCATRSCWENEALADRLSVALKTHLTEADRARLAAHTAHMPEDGEGD